MELIYLLLLIIGSIIGFYLNLIIQILIIIVMFYFLSTKKEMEGAFLQIFGIILTFFIFVGNVIYYFNSDTNDLNKIKNQITTSFLFRNDNKNLNDSNLTKIKNIKFNNKIIILKNNKEIKYKKLFNENNDIILIID
jgi:energy-coupling factor transporter transmembrane protein EcfT